MCVHSLSVVVRRDDNNTQVFFFHTCLESQDDFSFLPSRETRNVVALGCLFCFVSVFVSFFPPHFPNSPRFPRTSRRRIYFAAKPAKSKMILIGISPPPFSLTRSRKCSNLGQKGEERENPPVNQYKEVAFQHGKAQSAQEMCSGLRGEERN